MATRMRLQWNCEGVPEERLESQTRPFRKKEICQGAVPFWQIYRRNRGLESVGQTHEDRVHVGWASCDALAQVISD